MPSASYGLYRPLLLPFAPHRTGLVGQARLLGATPSGSSSPSTSAGGYHRLTGGQDHSLERQLACEPFPTIHALGTLPLVLE